MDSYSPPHRSPYVFEEGMVPYQRHEFYGDVWGTPTITEVFGPDARKVRVQPRNPAHEPFPFGDGPVLPAPNAEPQVAPEPRGSFGS